MSSIRFFWASRLQEQLKFFLLSTSTWPHLALRLSEEHLHLAMILTTLNKVVSTLVGDLVSLVVLYIYLSFWSFYSVLAYILIFTDILTDRFFISQNFIRMSVFCFKALISQVNILMWTLTLPFVQVMISKFSFSDSLRLRPLVQVGFLASSLFVIFFKSPLALLIGSVWTTFSFFFGSMTTHFF